MSENALVTISTDTILLSISLAFFRCITVAIYRWGHRHITLRMRYKPFWASFSCSDFLLLSSGICGSKLLGYVHFTCVWAVWINWYEVEYRKRGGCIVAVDRDWREARGLQSGSNFLFSFYVYSHLVSSVCCSHNHCFHFEYYLSSASCAGVTVDLNSSGVMHLWSSWTNQT